MKSKRWAPLVGLGVGLLAMAPSFEAKAARLHYRAEVPDATSWYRPVHVADVDGDGRPDILVGNWGANTVEVWQYDTSLKHAVKSQTIAVPFDIHGIATGDVDEDGDVDVVVAIRGFGVYLCRNDGGSWTVQLLDSRYAWNVQVADVDGDGHLDVFAALDGIGGVLLYGDGTGNFSAGATPALVWPGGVNVADFDGDGALDLIGPDMGLGRMVAYRNLGARAWSSNLGPPSTYPYQLVSELTPSAKDLYGNGNLDPVALFHSADGYAPPMSLVVFEGSGAPSSPSWTPRVLDVLPTRSLPVGEADLDDDGKLDIFLGGWAAFTGFRAYLGDGTGGFTPEDVPYGYGLGSRNSFSVVDFDGDGSSDVVACRQQLGQDEPSHGFAILYGIPTFRCEGFEQPFASGPVTVNKRRSLPFKASLFRANGALVTGSDVAARPRIRILYHSSSDPRPIDVTAAAVPAGAGADHEFTYTLTGSWQYIVKGGSYAIPGIYEVSMLSGDEEDYLIDPTCNAKFVIP